MKKLAKTLRKHESLLLNWFESQGLSSGIVEGFNNKAKLTMRKAYGFRTFENIQIALFHQLENFLSRNLPTDSADEAELMLLPQFRKRRPCCNLTTHRWRPFLLRSCENHITEPSLILDTPFMADH